MKTLVAVLAVAVLFVVGAMAYAHGPGAGGWGGGHMMGEGYGGHMMGPGYGGHMMGRGGPGEYGADKKFLDETADLRRELHDKRFEYAEAARDPETNHEKITTLEKELYEIQSKIREKAPRTASGGYGGYGHCW